MRLRVFLLAGQVSNAVQRLTIPHVTFRGGNPTAEERKIVEEKPAELWHWLLKRPVPQWIAIPAHGKAEFQAFVEISPKTEDGQVANPPPGVYDLQCEVEYSPHSISSGAFLTTNEWTSAEDIEKAKAAGVFLQDEHRLWTGRMQSKYRADHVDRQRQVKAPNLRRLVS